MDWGGGGRIDWQHVLVLMEAELYRLGNRNYKYRLRLVLWRPVYYDAFVAA